MVTRVELGGRPNMNQIICRITDRDNPNQMLGMSVLLFYASIYGVCSKHSVEKIVMFDFES